MEVTFLETKAFKNKVILGVTIALGIILIAALLFGTNGPFSASFGSGWVSAFWAAYNGDIVGTLMSIGGTYLTLAAAAVGALASPAAVALFL